MSEIQPIEITNPKPGMFVVDFGQNFAGWCRIKVRGQRGQVVKLHHAELKVHHSVEACVCLFSRLF